MDFFWKLICFVSYALISFLCFFCRRTVVVSVDFNSAMHAVHFFCSAVKSAMVTTVIRGALEDRTVFAGASDKRNKFWSSATALATFVGTFRLLARHSFCKASVRHFRETRCIESPPMELKKPNFHYHLRSSVECWSWDLHLELSFSALRLPTPGYYDDPSHGPARPSLGSPYNHCSSQATDTAPTKRNHKSYRGRQMLLDKLDGSCHGWLRKWGWEEQKWV